MKNLTYFFLFFLYGCDSGVEIERIAPEKLIAVSSLISPQDSLVKVYVFRAGALGDVANLNAARIKDAEVSINDGQNVRKLVFDDKNGCYQILNKTLKVTASKTYTLSVKTSALAVTATCQVPEPLANAKVSGIQEGNNYNYIFDWADDPNQPRYFTYDSQVFDVDFKPKLGQSTGPYTGLITSNNFLIDREEAAKKTFEQVVYNAFLADRVSVKTTFKSLDVNAYKYLKTKADASIWGANTDNFFPQLQEPQPVYSNILGGVGIFGAYNKSAFVTKIK